jgi:hypothetical protein
VRSCARRPFVDHRFTPLTRAVLLYRYYAGDYFVQELIVWMRVPKSIFVASLLVPTSLGV